MAEPKPPHTHADQAFRRALAEPTSLRAFLRRAAPAHADLMDFDHTRVLNPALSFDGLQARECDLLVEIPYRTPAGLAESLLVCVLIEHQTATDWRLPLRTLIYAALYWDGQWKAWETQPGDKPPFSLRPLLPIVLYAAPRPWGTTRTLAELFPPDNPFRDFTPRWEPLFWELAAHDAYTLLNSTEAFDQFLAVVRDDAAPADEFEGVLRQSLEHLQTQHTENHVRLSDMLNLIFTWATRRRPAPEHERLKRVAMDAVKDDGLKREMIAMVQTIADKWFEDGIQEGKIQERRANIIRLARKRFGQSNSEAEAVIEKQGDLTALEAVMDRLFSAKSWAELLD